MLRSGSSRRRCVWVWPAKSRRQPEASALRYPLAIAYRELGRLDDARHQLGERWTVAARFADPLIEDLPALVTGSGIHLMFGNRARRRGDL